MNEDIAIALFDGDCADPFCTEAIRKGDEIRQVIDQPTQFVHAVCPPVPPEQSQCVHTTIRFSHP